MMENINTYIKITSPLVVAFLITFGIKGQSHVIDNTMTEIRDNTGQTAQHTKKGSYEYATIFISSFAFLTAVVTLYYTVYTYISQRETQKNTTPAITKLNQIETLYDIATRLLDNYEKSLAIRVCLSKYAKNKLVSPLNLVSQIIPTDEIHLELFYGDGDSKEVKNSYISQIERNSPYMVISEIKEEIKIYNRYLEIIANELVNPSFDIKYKKSVFDNCVLYKPIDILYKICNAVNNIYGDKYDIRVHFVEFAVVNGLFLTCTDVNNGIKTKHLNGKYIQLINEYNSKANWGSIFDEKFDFKEKIAYKDIDLQKFMTNMALKALYYLADVNENCKIYLIPFKINK